MPAIENSVAAATAVVGYDLIADEPLRQAGYDRNVRGLALAGSAAAGDSKVKLMVGNVEVATAYNKATGFPTRDHMVPMGAKVPGGTEVRVVVTDAPATNPLNVIVDFDR